MVGGLGHTISLVESVQNSLIFSYRYCLRSGDRPFGIIVSGSSCGDGFHDLSFNNVIFFSIPLLEFLICTTPGVERENLKCWNLDMLLRAVLVTRSSKNSDQLYVGTSKPSSRVPTN